MMQDFDRVTELQKMEVQLEKTQKNVDFKKTVIAILNFEKNHGIKFDDMFNFNQKLPGESKVKRIIQTENFNQGMNRRSISVKNQHYDTEINHESPWRPTNPKHQTQVSFINDLNYNSSKCSCPRTNRKH